MVLDKKKINTMLRSERSLAHVTWRTMCSSSGKIDKTKIVKDWFFSSTPWKDLVKVARWCKEIFVLYDFRKVIAAPLGTQLKGVNRDFLKGCLLDEDATSEWKAFGSNKYFKTIIFANVPKP